MVKKPSSESGEEKKTRDSQKPLSKRTRSEVGNTSQEGQTIISQEPTEAKTINEKRTLAYYIRQMTGKGKYSEGHDEWIKTGGELATEEAKTGEARNNLVYIEFFARQITGSLAEWNKLKRLYIVALERADEKMSRELSRTIDNIDKIFNERFTEEE